MFLVYFRCNNSVPIFKVRGEKKMKLTNLLIECKQGDKNALLDIILEFMPLINKYNRKYFKEDISSELIISMIEGLEKMDIANNISDGQFANYISTVIRNKYIDIVRKNIRFNTEMLTDNITRYQTLTTNIESIESKLNFYYLIKPLTKNQKWVLEQIFIHQKTEVEVAKDKGVTKQAIHNTKKQAFKRIKENLEREKIRWNQKC